MIDIDVRLEESFYKKLGLKGKTYEQALDKAIDHALSDGVNICRREAPIKTGQLRRKTDKRKPSKCEGEIINTARNGGGEPYWQYVQYGTSKMNANPFVTRTANQIKPKLSRYVEEEIKSMGVS